MNARTRLVSTLGLTLALFGASTLAIAQSDKKETKGAKVGEAAPAWTLTDIKGKEWKSTELADKIVVLEWVNPQCPVCKGAHKDGRIAKMVADLKTEGAVHLAINSSHFTNADENDKALKAYGVEYPVLLDVDGKVGKAFGARTTPHMFVIDGKGVLRYSGALDNNAKGDKTGTDLINYAVNAVKQIKAGETVAPDYTQSYGCSVKYGNTNKANAGDKPADGTKN